MKKEMLEALRLTREGRLTEAKAVIERALGKGAGHAPGRGRSYVLEPPQLPDASEAEPAREPPETGATEPTAEPREKTTSTLPVPTPPIAKPFKPPVLTGLGERAEELIKKLVARGPARRPISPENIAPATGRWVAGTFSGEAGTRAYKLYVPSRWQEQPLPLLVMLHGCTQDPDDFAAGTRMNFLAETEGFLVVYPEQAAAANASRCWNWFQPSDQQRDQGEPSLIAGITRALITEHKTDANRVYVAGLSAGGALAAIMAAAYPDLYAAVGVHSGLAPGSAHDLPSALQAMQRGVPRNQAAAPRGGVPMILFHGDHDSTVHPDNAENLIGQWIPTSGSAQVTTRRGRAPGGRAYTCAVYANASGQTLVERWTVHGADHAWSGGSSNGTFTDPTGPDASKEVWRFFQEHPRPVSTHIGFR
jgi:poly(hydroxyalkanoate) depolymerase family esterase